MKLHTYTDEHGNTQYFKTDGIVCTLGMSVIKPDAILPKNGGPLPPDVRMNVTKVCYDCTVYFVAQEPPEYFAKKIAEDQGGEIV